MGTNWSLPLMAPIPGPLSFLGAVSASTTPQYQGVLGLGFGNPLFGNSFMA